MSLFSFIKYAFKKQMPLVFIWIPGGEIQHSMVLSVKGCGNSTLSVQSDKTELLSFMHVYTEVLPTDFSEMYSIVSVHRTAAYIILNTRSPILDPEDSEGGEVDPEDGGEMLWYLVAKSNNIGRPC